MLPAQSEICSNHLCQNSQYRQQDATSKEPWAFDGGQLPSSFDQFSSFRKHDETDS